MGVLPAGSPAANRQLKPGEGKAAPADAEEAEVEELPDQATNS